MSSIIHVRAPCRLHFGMFSFGQADRPQFGGVGAMVESPGVEVSITPAAKFCATGALPDRTLRFADAAIAAWGIPTLPHCEIHVRSPRDHVGLGVGTQLGLAVASALQKFLKLPERPVELLAQDIGRGRRSAVGTHGFQHGGLIVDAGHKPGKPLGTLVVRIAVPEQWRFVLASPADKGGLAGQTELDAFSRLPPVPEEVTRRLWETALREMKPALERRRCREFGEAVYRFGRLAGECFATVQSGPFASREIAHLIDAIRGHGVPGVGQSSWGPTVFTICKSLTEAEGLCDWLRSQAVSGNCCLSITSPNNDGARVEEVESPTAPSTKHTRGTV